MSKQALGSFVHKLHQELQGYKEYRSLLNLEQHTFVFNKRTLVSQTIKQLQKGGNKLPKEILGPLKTHLVELSNTHGNKLISRLEAIAGSSLPKPGGKVTLVFSSDTTVPLPAHYKMKPLELPTFSKVKLAYRDILNDYFKDMQDWLEQNADEFVVRNKDKSIKKSIKFFFDAGHEEGYGVFERFIDDATLNIAKSLELESDEDSIAARDRLLRELADLGFELEIAKVDNADSIIIKIESTYLNRQRGAQTGQRSKKLREAVLDFIEKYPLENLEGSDSIKTRKRKEVLHKTLDPFKKLKNVKVTTENIKIKESNTKVSKSYKSKVTGKSKKIGSIGAIGATKIKRSKRPKKSIVSLIGILNAKLPRTVQKNMGAPALVNRTGRFASSVRVTDVAITPKGFPSIGYTYQLGPYQTFEPGYAQGSTDRDPRTLIDKSIREIAASMAIGRFYTRRV